MFTDEIDAFSCQHLSFLFCSDHSTYTHSVFINWHEGDEGLENISNCPGRLPVLGMVISKSETNLFLHLKSSTWCQENYIRWAERIATRQSDNTVIETSLEGCTIRSSYSEMPFEGFVFQGLCIEKGWGISLHISLLLLDALHCDSIISTVHDF